MDFSVTYTDFGVCFIFNGESGEMKVNDVGSDVGLKLGINLEQYEYMSGQRPVSKKNVDLKNCFLRNFRGKND